MAPPELLPAAMQLLSAGAWLQAETAAQAAVAADPRDPIAALVLGLAVAAMGEDARAAPILAAAAALRPGADHPCLDLARLTLPLPRALVARQFRACLRLSPADDRLRLSFAAFLLDIDQPAEAQTILADGPDTTAAHHLMGLARAEQARFPAAIAQFSACCRAEPGRGGKLVEPRHGVEDRRPFRGCHRRARPCGSARSEQSALSRQPGRRVAEGGPVGVCLAGL